MLLKKKCIVTYQYSSICTREREKKPTQWLHCPDSECSRNIQTSWFQCYLLHKTNGFIFLKGKRWVESMFGGSSDFGDGDGDGNGKGRTVCVSQALPPSFCQKATTRWTSPPPTPSSPRPTLSLQHFYSSWSVLIFLFFFYFFACIVVCSFWVDCFGYLTL